MRYYTYTHQGNIRQIMQVDKDTIELTRETAHIFNHQVSELNANEAGENLYILFLTPEPLDTQAKLTILADCAPFFIMLKPGARIHL